MEHLAFGLRTDYGWADGPLKNAGVGIQDAHFIGG